tara:strand:+ start:697 stop:1293 length:597 start_codon:yes stop_codon:yes gene_type:complete
MIKFNNLSSEAPFQIFKDKYSEALKNGQKNIEAASISSFNKEKNEVDSRFVNIKFINDKEFIFFTNYHSLKSASFKTHNQISALFFWDATNTQIRIKGFIKKTSKEFNQSYFEERSKNKNALAISSNQSKTIRDYDDVVKKFNKVKNEGNLSICPDYWGGYAFNVCEIEFWKGNNFRLNKRELYKNIDNEWAYSTLQP